MSAIERHENVDRFVASARRLIIIQIIVAIIALIAAVAATVLIWRAFVEQGEAAQATLAAETAKEEASAAKKQADEAVQQSQREQRRIATMRPILQATTWQEYASAADALEETARQIPDEDVYALLASANYRGADADNPERVGRLVKATALLLEATRLNKQRVEATDETDAFTSQDKHNAELYVEYIGVQCSALKSSPSRSADILNSLQLLAAPDDVIETIRTENLLRDTPIIQRECDRSIIQSIETLYGIEPVRSVAVANLEDFEIEKVFMHISDERDRSLAIEISEDLELGSDVAVPGTERIVSDASAYKASVRYYHQEQATQAAAIQNAVLSSANANDANWSASDIPLIKLNLKDLPRDRLEVWLPSRSSLKTSRRAKFDISESVNVYYYQRGADGLSVLNTLETLLQESNLVVDSSEPGLTAVNAILCSENAPPETLESAKQLALSLLDAGVAIKQVAASDAPIADTGIEIRHAVSADALPVLTSDQINALQTCPRNL